MPNTVHIIHVPATVGFSCELCGCESKTPQAHNWHMYNMHGVRHHLRNRVGSTTCECCMRDFHTRERICTHITASSKKCFKYYTDHVVDIDSNVIKKLENEAYEKTIALLKSGRRRAYAEHPPSRADGPLRAEAVSLGVRHDSLLTVPPPNRHARKP